MNENWKIETLAVQSGYDPENGGPRVTPLVQSTTFRYDDAQSVADLFDLKREGFFYTRLANPTVDVLEKKMAALEGGVAAVATSAGQTANTLAIMNIARSGDHIVAVSSLYGGTVSLLTNTLKKFGVEVSFVQPDADSDTVRAAFRPNTKALVGETLANPALIMLDIERFAGIAHEKGVPLIVDNTFPTPVLCRPFDFGADIVTHSTTKYSDGHALAVGGIIIEKGDFDWKNGNFPELCNPDPSYHGLVYTDNFAACPYSVKLRAQFIRDLGVPMAPMNALLTNIGLETLHLRMERHSFNALKLAEHLQKHEKVAWVNYPGLKSNKYYDRAQKYLPNGTCGVVSFGVKGGRKAAEEFMKKLKLIAIETHVADARSCCLHPASATHRQMNDDELEACGITANLVRLSCGLENAEDLIADLKQALGE